MPTPGIVPATPEAASAAAPLKSPSMARSAANHNPAPIPINGIFLSRDLPTDPKALTTAFLITPFSATLPAVLPAASAASFPAVAPSFSAVFPAPFAPLPLNLPNKSVIPPPPPDPESSAGLAVASP